MEKRWLSGYGVAVELSVRQCQRLFRQFWQSKAAGSDKTLSDDVNKYAIIYVDVWSRAKKPVRRNRFKTAIYLELIL
jgi:hypothetical protein